MKHLLVIFCILFLFSCDDKIDDRLKKIVFDIIENPDKLRDLKTVYPEFVDDKYLYLLMNDKLYIDRNIKELKESFNKNTSGFIIDKVGIEARIEEFREKGYNINLNDTFCYYFCKNGKCFAIYFRIINNEIKLFMYGCVIDRIDR